MPTIPQPIPPPLLTALGGAAGVLRWGIMGTFAELPFYALMATQLLHGCTFAAVHLGTVGFLGIATPPTLRSSAQAIYTALSDGGFMCMATMMAAKLYSAYNNQVLPPSHLTLSPLPFFSPARCPANRSVGPQPDHCVWTQLLWERVAHKHTRWAPTSTAQTARTPFVWPPSFRVTFLRWLTNCARLDVALARTSCSAWMREALCC